MNSQGAEEHFGNKNKRGKKQDWWVENPGRWGLPIYICTSRWLSSMFWVLSGLLVLYDRGWFFIALSTLPSPSHSRPRLESSPAMTVLLWSGASSTNSHLLRIPFLVLSSSTCLGWTTAEPSWQLPLDHKVLRMSITGNQDIGPHI